MRRRRSLWLLALLITLASAYWQRVTGPSYPLRGRSMLGAQEIAWRLERTHGGPGDQPVTVRAPDAAVEGEILWRRYPSSEPWQALPMARSGETLTAVLPHQPPAGKLEYQVRLSKGDAHVALPERAAVTRFKGDVAPAVLAPHILAMFLSMLWGTRAGLGALAGEDTRREVTWTLVLLAIGGFVLGPVVQWQAFGDWWTGFPVGYDLTDNKTLLAAIAWLVAAWRLRGGRTARVAVVAAAVAMLAVFMIPHSVWGSEVRWDGTADVR